MGCIKKFRGPFFECMGHPYMRLLLPKPLYPLCMWRTCSCNYTLNMAVRYTKSILQNWFAYSIPDLDFLLLLCLLSIIQLTFPEKHRQLVSGLRWPWRASSRSLWWAANLGGHQVDRIKDDTNKIKSHLNNERRNSTNKQDTHVKTIHFTVCINIQNPEDSNYKEKKHNHELICLSAELFAVFFGCPKASLHLLTSPFGVGILQRNVLWILRLDGCQHLSPLKTNIP